MLSRRHLRVKAMQALYSFYQSENPDSRKFENDLTGGIDKFFDSYLLILSILPEFVDIERNIHHEKSQRHIPTKKKEDTSTRFIDNPLIHKLSLNSDFINKIKNRKISWQKEADLLKKLFNNLRKTEEFLNYLNESDKAMSDEELPVWIVKKFLPSQELFDFYMEERFLQWQDDKGLIISMTARWVKALNEDPQLPLFPVLKDEEDMEFVTTLFRQTLKHDQEFETMIGEKTKNWEVDRIALTDIILMKMALTEIISFSNIPVKVSINEYIDISKDYSTPKSKQFINGVVDKLVIEMKEAGKIRKIGRGLME